MVTFLSEKSTQVAETYPGVERHRGPTECAVCQDRRGAELGPLRIEPHCCKDPMASQSTWFGQRLQRLSPPMLAVLLTYKDRSHCYLVSKSYDCHTQESYFLIR